jgi:hypothetical protein
MKHHLTARLNVGVVHLLLGKSWVEILRAIRHGAHAKWLKTLDTYAKTLAIGKLQPAHIAPIARLLRTDVRK